MRKVGDSARGFSEIARKARQERGAFLAAAPIAAECDESHVSVTLGDGPVLRAPICWYPRLQKANASLRRNIALSPLGLHWPDLDEDISIASILRGQTAPGARAPSA